jgi:DNA-binding transcriptional regulator YhcF (GntR family)
MSNKNPIVDVFADIDAKRQRDAGRPIRATVRELATTATTAARIIRRELESFEDEQVIEHIQKRKELLAMGI